MDSVRAAAEPIGVVAERAGRVVLKTLAEAGGVAESGAHEAVSAHHGNNHTALMASR